MTWLLLLLAAPIDWDKAKTEATEKLGEYVRIDTTDPPGNESRAVEWLKKIFQAEGIPFEAGESAPGRGSIAARVKGQGREPALVLLSHIDVVPVNREFWTADPFKAEIRDGYLWGRGSVDTKSLGIAELETLLLLHRYRVPLKRDVIYRAPAVAEAGGLAGAGWVMKTHPEWVAGAGFLINEAARARVDDQGKPWFFLFGETEKTPGWLKLTAKGRAGHGAVPNPDSAVNHLVAALERLRTRKPVLEVTPAVERALKSRAPYEQEPWRGRYQNIRAFVQQPGAYEELLKRPAVLAILVNTINITGLEGSNKINIVPAAASALVDCRLLPGTTIEKWVDEIKRTVQDDSIAIEVVLNFPPAESPAESPLREAIKTVLARRFPGIGLADVVEGGFTDSHFFRDKGIASYGFGPFPMSEPDLLRVHGNDERIPVQTFREGVQTFYEIVEEFSRAR
jgi:acetylornithine deacetylase/succinyl-diaminopimelate desuccinylase-like protein